METFLANISALSGAVGTVVAVVGALVVYFIQARRKARKTETPLSVDIEESQNRGAFFKLFWQVTTRKLKSISTLGFNVLQLFSALITIITLLLGAGIVLLFINPQSSLLLLTYALGVISALTLGLIFLLRAKPPRWLLSGYKNVVTELLYEVDEDDPHYHTFTVSTEIEALRRGVSVFEDTYQWTGQGKAKPPKVLSPGHSLMGETTRGGWVYYYISLGHELAVGERTFVKRLQILYDIAGAFVPYLAHVVSVPTDILILKVRLLGNKHPSIINFNEWDSASGPTTTLIRSTPGKIDKDTSEIRWEIISPVFRHRYEIRWEY